MSCSVHGPRYNISMSVRAKILGVSVLTAGLILSSCSRSEGFKRESETYTDENPSYYYGPGDNPQQQAGTLTDRAKTLGQPKQRLVVFDFWNLTPFQEGGLGKYAANELKREIFLSKKVLLPSEVTTTLTTSDFVDADKIKVDQLVREGRRLGVQVLVIGRVTNVTFRQKGDEVGLFRSKESIAVADIELKVFDTQSGREISAIARSGQASSNTANISADQDQESKAYRAELIKFALRDAVQSAVKDVSKSLDKMMWVGRVAKIIGTQVFLNSGRESGLIRGDILRVLTQGEDIHDPETGAFLGRTDGQLKGTLEVVDFIGKDAAVGVIHSGGSVTEGDVVRLY